MKKIVLSYTTISNYHKSPHSYLNKMLDIAVPTTPAMSAGKNAHEIIEAHCTGKKKDKRLADFTWTFTDAERHIIRPSYHEKYNLHGYIDLIAYNSKVFAEVKTGTPWSQKKFIDSMQWKYYAMLTGFRKALMITCRFDLTDLKTYYFEVTDKDLKDAELWVQEAIVGIENANFRTDLDENGVCTRPDCPYGDACYFKKL